MRFMSVSKTNNVPKNIDQVAALLVKFAEQDKDKPCDQSRAGLEYLMASVTLSHLGLFRPARTMAEKAEAWYLNANDAALAEQCTQMCTDLDNEIAKTTLRKDKKTKKN